jgi:hypothetical protein
MCILCDSDDDERFVPDVAFPGRDPSLYFKKGSIAPQVVGKRPRFRLVIIKSESISRFGGNVKRLYKKTFTGTTPVIDQ